MPQEEHPSRSDVIPAVVKAYDVRGLVDQQLDETLVHDVGACFARILREEGETTIAIGHDMRPSSPGFAQAFARGAAGQGLSVQLLGLTSTDELYFAAGSLGCAGAMITASHNPATYNGIKLCRAGATPVSKDTGLGRIADDLINDVPQPVDDAEAGSIDNRDVLEEYAAFLRKISPVGKPRIGRDFLVAVDPGNGMAGLTAPAVLGGLPVEINGINMELDGTFPNHEANPLDVDNLKQLSDHVCSIGADIGLAFDGDADRCVVVDESGQPVSPSAITALIASRQLSEHPGATIIHNLITSRAVPEIITEEGGQAVRTRVGHSFIKAEVAKRHAVFGGEHSAHYYFTDFYNADSGLLAALHVLAELARQDAPLSELMSSYTRYAASGEINSRVDDQEAATEKVIDAFASRTADIDRLDGVTVSLIDDHKWFNLRASNTEPLLRLNVEAETQHDVDALVDEILGIIRG